MVILKKTPLLGNWAILDLQMMHPHNSGSALRIFLKNLHNESGQEVGPSYVNGLSAENSSLGQMHPFGSKNDMVSLL